VVGFLLVSFRFTTTSPPGVVIAPAEQAGSQLNVKSVNGLASVVAPCVWLSVRANVRMRLNLSINVLEDVAARYLSVIKTLPHLAVDLVPRPADVCAQETAQRAEQVGEVFDIARENVFAARARNSLRQLFIIFFRVVMADAQPGLAAGQTMTPSRPFDHDLRHIFTHKCSLIWLKPVGQLFKLSAPFAAAVEPYSV
jgi:hypothetical protein